MTLFLNYINERVNGLEKVRSILDWLRSIRTQVRWLFAGSVGLNNFAKRHNLSHSINDLTEMLNMLENDGYIISSDGKRFFRSPLLRDYWKEKYCSN